MLKLLGAVVLFSGISWCGWQKAQWYQRHLECLHTWRRSLMEGERQLCDLGMQTASYLEWMADQSGLKQMAMRCLNGLEWEERFSLTWTSAIREANFPLYEEEMNALISLGEVLGQYDESRQRQSLSYVGTRIQDAIRQGEEEKQRLGKMWRLLGMGAGAFAVVLLY